MGQVPEDPCAIARTLGVVGERWALLVVREASMGTTRFSDFRRNLAVAPDVLTQRLTSLVEHGVMERIPYQEPGERARTSYRLTAKGVELGLTLAALQQWGDEHLPWPEGPSVLRRVKGTDRPVRVAFVDERGREVAPEKVDLVRTAAYPTT